MSAPGPLLGAIEIALNRYLALDEDVLAQCAALDGRSLSVSIEDLEWQIVVVFVPAGVIVLPEGEAPDVRIRGRSNALLRMARSQFAGRGEMPGGIEVSGDAALLDRVRRMARAIGFDIEELLATVMPGPSAYRAASLLRRLADWAGRSASTLALDSAEYLREETRDLVHRADLEQWMDAVDELRDGVDRAEARLRRLEKRRLEAAP